MNCLPIVARELRVAARKRSTFWLRVSAAATGLLIGSGCLLFSTVQGTSTTEIGSALFYILTWLCFAAGLAAGLFFTSDCLSEEKREGTLGLLFLTQLRGYDVVLGKLLATSLRGFYALLAVLPILAITQLMGGVASGQYWKSSLALVNGLCLSLAAGLLVSALSRDSQKALAGTLLLVLLLALGGPVADALIARVRQRAYEPLWSLSSPAYVLVVAGAWGRSPYWKAVGVTQALFWGMLALACALAPHTWHERKGGGSRSSRSWSYAWRYGGSRRRARLRRKLLEFRPLAWLACRERWQSHITWALAILTAGGFASALISQERIESWILWNYFGGFFTLLLYLMAASQAGRVMVEVRRSGLLELLLVTPVSEREIVRNQWRAWLRLFGLPLFLLVAALGTAATLSQLSIQRMAAQIPAATSPSVVTNQSSGFSNQTVIVNSTVTVSVGSATNSTPAWPNITTPGVWQQAGLAAGAAAAAILCTLANFLAIGWFGMWMGMTSRTANLATLKTLVFVQVIPWFVITFATGMVVGLILARLFWTGTGARSAGWLVWYPLISHALWAAATIIKDVGFILWSRNRLYSAFRNQAALSHERPRTAIPPPLPLPITGRAEATLTTDRRF